MSTTIPLGIETMSMNMARRMARTMVIMAIKVVITGLNKYKLQNLQTTLKEKKTR